MSAVAIEPTKYEPRTADAGNAYFEVRVTSQEYRGNFATPKSLADNVGMVERRVDHERRKRVSEMSSEEMRHALLFSEKTGLPNRRAFDETEPTPWIAMCDCNGLKAMNDSYGYKAGDTLIHRLAEALKELGLDAYHNQGDEYIVRGESYRELDAKLSEAERHLRENPFVVHSMLDKVVPIKGTVFSYGIGTTLKEAESSLKHQKELRSRTKGD